VTKLPSSAAPTPAGPGRWLPIVAWIAAIGTFAVALYLGWGVLKNNTAAEPGTARPAASVLNAPERPSSSGKLTGMPAYQQSEIVQPITRQTSIHTIIPNRPRQEVKDYKVDTGDSVFEIASKFDIKPETVLWANYDLLNDNPDMISVGMDLQIPPVDGVYYQWQDGDTIDSVAARFEAKAEDILNFQGNQLDLYDPQIEPGTWIMIPGGHREFRQWIIPVIPRGRAGVSRSVYGAGACEGGYEGAYGSGSFVWPAGNHSLSGNDYWSGHLGIDIAAGEGAPIYAADSGVVVFAGWATGGYGNMVMIDHGNGYQTLYGHMSSVVASCGRSVGQGSLIGYSGSTGNSTGPHLHFEVRFQGGFVDPWYVLPAP